MLTNHRYLLEYRSAAARAWQGAYRDCFSDDAELTAFRVAYPGYTAAHEPAAGEMCYVARARHEGMNPSLVQASTVAGLRQQMEGVVPLDAGVPNIARVYDYWLGGKDWFEADRVHAERILEAFPQARRLARDNRRFLGEAVTWAAQRGIRQFIDIGAGLPTARNTHEIAREVNPGASVVYVDYDPVVVAHARALLETTGVAAIHGDMRKPGLILGHPELRDLIGLGEPVCVILASVLHFLPADRAREAATAFTAALAPGSAAVISVGRGDDEPSERFLAAYRSGGTPIYGFSLDQVMGLFDGLDLVPPGLASARLWKPGIGSMKPPVNAAIVAGAGVRP